MGIFLVTFMVMLLVVAGMAIGAIVKDKPIKGSCGGLNNINGMDCACQLGINEAREVRDGNFRRPAESYEADHTTVSGLAYKA